MKGFSGFSNLIEAAAKMSGKTVKSMADAMMGGSMMEDQSEKIKEKRIKSSGKSVGKFPKSKTAPKENIIVGPFGAGRRES